MATGAGTTGAQHSRKRLARVVEEMEKRSVALGEDDGLRYWHDAYLDVTKEVAEGLEDSHLIKDRRFIAHLDVQLARAYFEAVDTSERDPARTPRAWVPLLLEQRRNTAEHEPTQFLFSGLCAHVFHDLPIALVRTCAELRTTPDASTHERDFASVNTLIRLAEPQVARLLTKASRSRSNAPMSPGQTQFEMFSVQFARGVAWTNAEMLWTLRGMGPVSRAYHAVVDRSSELLCRAMFLTAP